MSSTIKQAIQALKSRVADAFAAVEAKGGTLPATQDTANLPAAIASIPSGGGTGYFYNFEQYGVPSADIALINGYFDEKLQESLPFGTIKDAPFVVTDENVGIDAFRGKKKVLMLFMTGGVFSGYQTFYNCQNIEYIILSENVTTNWSGGNSGSSTFWGCDKLRAIIGAPIVILSGITNMNGCFRNCTVLEEVYIDFRGSISWSINQSPLKYDCLIYLLNHLVEVTNSPTLSLGATNRATLNATAEGAAAIAAAQAKGWTIA